MYDDAYRPLIPDSKYQGTGHQLDRKVSTGIYHGEICEDLVPVVRRVKLANLLHKPLICAAYASKFSRAADFA